LNLEFKIDDKGTDMDSITNSALQIELEMAILVTGLNASPSPSPSGG
jgi:hypothetical protein